MKAIILAAGYGTRLADLAIGTKYESLLGGKPKALIPVGGRPAIEHIIDKILEAGVSDLIIITNSTFYSQFTQWKEQYSSKMRITLIDDQSTSNENRKGAIRDLAIAAGFDVEIPQQKVSEPVFVLSADRLFEFSLNEMAKYHTKKHNATTLVRYDSKSKELVKNSAELTLDKESRVIGFVEKPQQPRSTFLCPSLYIYSKAALEMLPQYLREGNPADPIGKFPMWLYKKEPVFAFNVKGYLFDLGSIKSYEEAAAFFVQKLK